MTAAMVTWLRRRVMSAARAGGLGAGEADGSGRA